MFLKNFLPVLQQEVGHDGVPVLAGVGEGGVVQLKQEQSDHLLRILNE